MPFARPRSSCLLLCLVAPVAAALDREVAEVSANTSKSCSGSGYPVDMKSEVPNNAGKTLGWWNMPAQDLSFAQNRSLAQPFTQLPAYGRYFTKDVTFSLVDADEGAHLMYNATKLNKKDGGDEVPKELGGVFWMKGNGIAEELTVLQYGKWYPTDGVYVAAYAPMVWSWPAGKPKDAPGGGIKYSNDSSQGAINAIYMCMGSTAISYAMSKCPPYATCSKWGNPLGNMSFGYMQLHPRGKLQDVSNIGDQLPIKEVKEASGAFTIEAKKDFSATNRVWRRKCQWGISSPSCANWNFGSYDLTQIIDGDGEKTQYFQDWVNYMHDDSGKKVQMIVWSGFKDDRSKKQLEKWYQ